MVQIKSAHPRERPRTKCIPNVDVQNVNCYQANTFNNCK